MQLFKTLLSSRSISNNKKEDDMRGLGRKNALIRISNLEKWVSVVFMFVLVFFSRLLTLLENEQAYKTPGVNSQSLLNRGSTSLCAMHSCSVKSACDRASMAEQKLR